MGFLRLLLLLPPAVTPALAVASWEAMIALKSRSSLPAAAREGSGDDEGCSGAAPGAAPTRHSTRALPADPADEDTAEAVDAALAASASGGLLALPAKENSPSVGAIAGWGRIKVRDALVSQPNPTHRIGG